MQVIIVAINLWQKKTYSELIVRVMKYVGDIILVLHIQIVFVIMIVQNVIIVVVTAKDSVQMDVIVKQPVVVRTILVQVIVLVILITVLVTAIHRYLVIVRISAVTAVVQRPHVLAKTTLVLLIV